MHSGGAIIGVQKMAEGIRLGVSQESRRRLMGKLATQVGQGQEAVIFDGDFEGISVIRIRVQLSHRSDALGQPDRKLDRDNDDWPTQAQLGL